MELIFYDEESLFRVKLPEIINFGVLFISLEVLAYPRFCSSSLSTAEGPTSLEVKRSSSKGERAAASEVEIANTTRDQMLRARRGTLTITMPRKESFVRLVYFYLS